MEKVGSFWKFERYRRKAASIIREWGFAAFVGRVWSFFCRRARGKLLEIELKVLAGFYTRGFHRLYYYSNVWADTWMLGVKTSKCPLDLWVYQEMIFETKPDFIVETGTREGGSALFFASVCELVGRGQVVTIDIEDCGVVSHPRITKVLGNSVSEEVVKTVEELVGGKRAMVVLDSAHNKEHVLREMELYSRFF
jgi:cephalosporin hydroxylase